MYTNTKQNYRLIKWYEVKINHVVQQCAYRLQGVFAQSLATVMMRALSDVCQKLHRSDEVH